MNLDVLRTCACGFAGIEKAEGVEGAFDEVAVETAVIEIVEDLDQEEWNTNGWSILVSVRDWKQHSVS